MLYRLIFRQRVVRWTPNSSAALEITPLQLRKVFIIWFCSSIDSVTGVDRIFLLTSESFSMRINSGGRCSLFIILPRQSTKPCSIIFSSSLIFPGKSWLIKVLITFGLTLIIFLPVLALNLLMKWSTRYGISSRLSFKGGNSNLTTARRKYRSSLNFACATSCLRSLFVAATILISALMVSVLPRGSYSLSCRSRRSLTCMESGSSPISSKKTVPPFTAASFPFLSFLASVNAPLT